MKPDYKNWMPKGMICGGFAVTLVFLILFILFGLTGIVGGTLKTVLFIILLILTIISCAVSVSATSAVFSNHATSRKSIVGYWQRSVPFPAFVQ